MPRRITRPLANRFRGLTRLRALACVSASALLLAGCQTGSDGFTDGTTNDEAPDVAMVRSFMEGLGAVDGKTEKKIEYKPRAPLAMPTKMDTLPPPENPDVIANWPETNDAELKRVQQAYANDGRGSGHLDGAGRSSPQQARGLPSLAKDSSSRNVQQEIKLEDRLENGRMTPAELRTQKVGTVDTSNLMGADGQPVRRYLIEPPTEYSTPAADAPMAAPKRVDRQPEVSDMEKVMNGQSARTLK